MTQETYSGMGAIPHPNGVAFRVWAPNCTRVSVVGSFNDWDPEANSLKPSAEGYWYGDVNGAQVGDEYRFHLENGDQQMSRIDPYAREVTSSIGNAVVQDKEFDWADDAFSLPPLNELVIYELHIGTFRDSKHEGPGDFASAATRLSHLQKLGINCIEIMPLAEFPGDYSWGYNPSHTFAVETAYGGPKGLKQFVKRCHSLGIGVLLDVVYNHFGPGDLDLWQFDGWSENGKGGIYFYQDERSHTPWGETRPDYGRPEVCRFLQDSATMWLEEFRFDGLRYDGTVFMRKIDGSSLEIPDAWTLLQTMNGHIRARLPTKVLIAEDLQDEDALTAPIEVGGGGFHSQWSAAFVHPVRRAVTEPNDERRSMEEVRRAIEQKFNNDVFQRVIYSESHDEVANGHQRVPSEVQPDDPHAWFARKRSTLAAGLVFTSPGVPMLFQGQEFLETGWFQDTVPVDWDLSLEFSGIVCMYRDLIALRLNRHGTTRGLCGQGTNFFRVDEEKNLIAFLRQDRGGPGDDVVVVANFSNQAHEGHRVGFPAPGPWQLRLNSDWTRYDRGFRTPVQPQIEVEETPWDSMPCSAELILPPYSFLIFSQDPQ